jgi:hypothetical protein
MAEINIDSLAEKFQNHLNIGGNHRTIFSGKFGTGKTYFLNKFFKENSNTYNTIVINPVNYVVSSNEDIFELIKADIVNDLFFTGKIEFSKLAKSKLFEKLFLFSAEKPEAIIKFVSSLLSKFNPLFEFTDTYLKSVKELKESFTEYSKELTKKEKSRHEELLDFVDSLEEKKGSIYEHNYITKVINTFLEELKGKDCEKKNVLVIDDLDRIDPEHIFRILNILSAHNNHFGQENKFAFDHIIVVCDLQNIQKIFFHKYGLGVDFEGYIDKFFSTDIFFINNEDAILIYVNSLNEELKFSNAENQLIIFLLQLFVREKVLTIRKLMKLSFTTEFDKFIINKYSSIKPQYYNIIEFRFIQKDANLFIDSNDLTIIRIFLLFCRIFGSLHNFRKELDIDKKDFGEMILMENQALIYYLTLQDHIVKKDGEDLYINKETYYDQARETNIVARIDWPNNTLFNVVFKFNVGWRNGNSYKGENSYFSQTQVQIEDQNIHSHEVKKIKIANVVSSIRDILDNCYKKDLFKTIGI